MKRAWLTGCPVGRVRSSWSTPMPNPHRACRTQCNERWIASRPNSSGPAEKHPTITSRCSSANKCGPRGRSCDWSWKPQRTTRCNARISATSPPPANRPLNLPCRNTRGVDYSSTRYQPSSLRACTQVLRGAGRHQARVSSTLIPAMAARADPPRFLDAHHRTPRYAPSQKRLPNLAGCMGARGLFRGRTSQVRLTRFACPRKPGMLLDMQPESRISARVVVSGVLLSCLLLWAMIAAVIVALVD